MSKLLAEIRRRRVIQTFLPYLGFVWLILQIVSVITPMLNWHPLVNTFFAVALFAGIPVMLYLSWYFDFTTQGLVPIPDKTSGEITSFGIIRWALLLTITASSGILGFQYFHDIKIEYAKTQDGLAQKIEANSIAVLPFKDNSPDQDQAFLAQGLAEEITSLLGQTDGLKVSASSSTAILSEKGLDPVAIARRLEVQTILTGSLRKTGDQLKVRVELISASDGKVLWTETFARKFADIFAVESEIARSTVNLLQDTYIESGSLSNQATTKSTDAYVIYLKGREQYRKQTTESMKSARKLFEQAIGLDPEYAQAYVALADTIALLAEGPERFGVLKVDIAAQLSEQHINKALLRNPNIPEAYAVLGYVSRLEQNHDEAIERFDKALSLNPNLAVVYNWKFLVYREMGKQSASYDSALKAFKLDPISLVSQHNYGFALSLRGKFLEATAIFEQLIAEHPQSPLGFAGLGDTEFSLGNYAKSLNYWKKAYELSPENDDYKNGYIATLQLFGLTDHARQVSQDPFYEPDFLLREKRYEELFSLMDFQLSANPEDPWIAFENAWYQSLVGDKKTAIRLLLQSSQYFNNQDIYNMPWCSPAIEIAWALKESAQIIKFNQMLETCKTKLLNERKNNIAQHELDYLAARIAALEEKSQDAIENLSLAIKHGWREWWTGKDPIFDSIKHNPKFVIQVNIIENDLAKQKVEALLLLD